jgi:hypothetical protein
MRSYAGRRSHRHLAHAHRQLRTCFSAVCRPDHRTRCGTAGGWHRAAVASVRILRDDRARCGFVR